MNEVIINEILRSRKEKVCFFCLTRYLFLYSTQEIKVESKHASA